MRTERLQHFPDDFVDLVVVERFVRLHAIGNDDRKYDVAELLFAIRRATHDAAHGLHHIHLRVTRRQEQHRIERRNIDAFRQTADVA